jgi:hypothetical protein
MTALHAGRGAGSNPEPPGGPHQGVPIYAAADIKQHVAHGVASSLVEASCVRKSTVLHTLARGKRMCICPQVWVITGDKQETAINIAISCKLILHPDSLLICNADSYDGAELS